MKGNTVFVVREFSAGGRELGIFGVYSSQKRAEGALILAHPWIKFRETDWTWRLGAHQHCFRIDEYTVNPC